MEKEEKTIKRKFIPKPGQAAAFLSFFAPFVIMLAIFIGNGIFPFGNRSFLFSDMYHQYMPFFQEFMHKIKAGEGIDYSWNIGMGSNFLALYVYYLASPIHWLAFLLPEAHLMEFMSYLVIFKLGAAGTAAYVYLRFKTKTADFGEKMSEAVNLKSAVSALLFSCFYALSGFVAAYNWNIMWLDCVILLPLILMGLEKLVHQGKMGMYCLCLGLSIFSNFYISIMICMFLVLYFIYLFFVEKMSIKAVFRFAGASLAAGGLAAIFLVPEVCALMATDFGDIMFPKELKSYFSVIDILARHCMGITTERALEHWPNIYCGAAVFLLVPLFALNDKISLKKRFGMLVLAGIFLLSFGTNVLEFIWHGMNYPDSLPARQSFIYILLILVMCYETVVHIDGIEPKTILKVYLGDVLTFLVIEKFVEVDDFQNWTWIANLAYVTFYAVIMHFYRTRKSGIAYAITAMLAFVAVVSECAINMAYTSVGTTDRAAYLDELKDYETLCERNLPMDDFVRVEKFNRKTKNDSALVGFPSASVFSSTLNSDVMDFYKRIGMRYSKVFYCYDGATAFSSALLNVGFMFDASDTYENELYELIDREGEVCMYEAMYQLPFGYVAPVGYDLPEGMKENGINIQTEMAAVLGAKGKLFQKVAAQDSGDDILFTPDRDGIYYGFVATSGTKKIDMLGGAMEKVNYKDLKKGSILYLGHLDKNQTVTLTNGDDTDTTPNISVYVYRMNEECLKDAIDILSKQHMTKVKVSNTQIEGQLLLEESGRVILSVPYEEGWKILVNGQAVEPEKFGGAFLALDLEPGEYTIELNYSPKGKTAGIVITILSIVIVGSCFGIGARIRRKKERKQEAA